MESIFIFFFFLRGKKEWLDRAVHKFLHSSAYMQKTCQNIPNKKYVFTWVKNIPLLTSLAQTFMFSNFFWLYSFVYAIRAELQISKLLWDFMIKQPSLFSLLLACLIEPMWSSISKLTTSSMDEPEVQYGESIKCHISLVFFLHRLEFGWNPNTFLRLGLIFTPKSLFVNIPFKLIDQTTK